MGKQIARVGDQWTGTCNNHSPSPPRPVSGVVTSTPQDFTFDEGRLAAVDGAICPANCGHTGLLMASSALTNVNGIKLGLLGDMVIGPGIRGKVISASTLTNSD